MALVNNFYDFSAGNSIRQIGNLRKEMSKLLDISKAVVGEINEISKLEININLNTKDIENNIDDVSDRIKALSNDIVGTMSKVNGEISKVDNNSNLRGIAEKDFSKLYDGIASYVGEFSEALLPSDAGSILTGASKGFAAGMLTGNPIIAVAATIIGAGAEWALSEVKKKTNRINQRVGFASGILKTYLPQIAMSSLRYAEDMEQSKINYHNILGKDNGSMLINDMLNLSNKGFYEYSDLDNTGKQMLAAGFDYKEIMRIFDTVGNASVANGAGKQGALQMIEAIKTMQSTGNVSIDALEIFRNIGVDAYGILADSMKIAGKNTKVTKEELKELVSKGVVPADQAITNLVNGMKYKYAGMMYTYQQSFSGLIASIKNSTNQIILGPLGKGFIEGIKPALSRFSEFFGLGTKGFKDLGEEIFNFGEQIGQFAGNAINNFQNMFSKLFNNEEFNNADLPGKFFIVFEGIEAVIDNWYKTSGAKKMEELKDFFTKYIKAIGSDSDFKNAVQDLWLVISPDADTIKKIFGNPIKNYIIGALREIFPLYASIYDASTSYINFISDLNDTDPFNQDAGVVGGGIVGGGIAARGIGYAIGLNRVPYDYYPALLHEGEAVLRRTEADDYRNGVGKGIIISKIADTIVVKDETDMYKLADILVSEIEKAGLVYGGAM